MQPSNQPTFFWSKKSPPGAARETKDCGGYRVYCGHNGEDGAPAHRWDVLIGCGEVHCRAPACVERHTRKRARRIRGVFNRCTDHLGLERTGLISINFTVPDTVRDKCTQKELTALRRAARRILSWHLPVGSGLDPAQAGRPGWSIGTVDTVHPEGDKEPGAWLPHVVVLVPTLIYHTGRAAWSHLPLKQPVQVLYLVRCAWGIALHEILGWNGEVDRCDVHFEFAAGDDLKAWNHVTRYNFRHWPGYAGDFRRVVWSGWLSPVRLSAIGLGGVMEEIDAGELKEPTTIRCPICGREPEVKIAVYSGPWKKQVPDWLLHAVYERKDTT